MGGGIEGVVEPDEGADTPRAARTTAGSTTDQTARRDQRGPGSVGGTDPSDAQCRGGGKSVVDLAPVKGRRLAGFDAEVACWTTTGDEGRGIGD